MRLTKVEKMVGQSWFAWFIESLNASRFTKADSNKYVKGNIEVRIFRAHKYYQVWKDGECIADNLQFTFPQTTGVLFG